MPSAAAAKPTIRVEGVNELLRALSKMDKALSAEVRDASQEIAGRFAASVTGRAATRLEVAVAAGVKARRDRVPVVAMGTGKLSSGTPISAVMYGAEFGGRGRPTTRQFQPHRGTAGYFLYPTIRAEGRQAAEEWADHIFDILGRYWNKPT